MPRLSPVMSHRSFGPVRTGEFMVNGKLTGPDHHAAFSNDSGHPNEEDSDCTVHDHRRRQRGGMRRQGQDAGPHQGLIEPPSGFVDDLLPPAGGSGRRRAFAFLFGWLALLSILILRSAVRRVSQDGDGLIDARASSFETPALASARRAPQDEERVCVSFFLIDLCFSPSSS